MIRRTIWMGAALAATLFSVPSFAQTSASPNPPPPAPGATPPTDTMHGMSSAKAMDASDPAFAAATLSEMHHVNQGEIQMAELAKKNAQSKDVKKFAARMIKDHTSLDKQGSDFAKKHNITVGDDQIPKDAAHQADMKKGMDMMAKLQGLQGAPFDQAYMSAMADGHGEALAMVQAAHGKATDKSMKKLLGSAEKVIASHKKEADKLAAKTKA